MFRRPAILALLLAAIALLGLQPPAGAHPGASVPLDAPTAGPAIGAAVSDVELAAGRVLAAAPEAPGVPWLTMLGALGALAIAIRWPRRALALALVLVLAIFAFEDGLHSVHHGFDAAKVATCDVAATGQHLSATTVDDPVPVITALPTAPMTVEGSPSPSASRFLCPDLGRAPPLHTV